MYVGRGADRTFNVYIIGHPLSAEELFLKCGKSRGVILDIPVIADDLSIVKVEAEICILRLAFFERA